MKIVYVIQYFGSPDNSFASGRSWDFAHEWAKMGHNVWIICSDAYFIDKTQLPDFSDNPTISISVIHQSYENSFSFFNRLNAFLGFSIKALFKLLNNPNKYDIAYISSTPLTTGLIGLIQKKITGKNWIFELRDLWPDFPIQALGLEKSYISKVLYWAEQVLYRSASKIICLSPMANEILLKQKKVPAEKLSTIPNGFTEFSNLEKFQTKVISFEKVYLYEGALGKANHIQWLLKFFDTILNQDTEAKVIIAGFGIHENLIHQWKEHHNLTNQISFLGKISRDQIRKILPTVSYCLVTFSDWKILQSNSPNKLFDAISLGIPVITNTKGWIAQLAEESGGFFESDPIKAAYKVKNKFPSINLDFPVLHSKFKRSNLASIVIDSIHNCG